MVIFILNAMLLILCDRRLFRVSIYMFKCMKGLILDRNLVNMFETLSLQHGVGTRAQQREDLVVVQTRTLMGDHAFSVFGARIWNSLPLNLRGSKSVLIFTNEYWRLQAVLYDR